MTDNPVSMGVDSPAASVTDSLIGAPQQANFATQRWTAPISESSLGFKTPTMPQEPIFQIVGANFQVVNIPLQPDQEIIASPGTMMHMSNDVKMVSKMGGLWSGIGRMGGGESAFKVHFKNSGNEVGYIGLTPNFPARVVPINLDESGGEILCKLGAYMASMNKSVETVIDRNPARNCVSCCCGGLPPIVQRIYSGDSENRGWVFLAAGGTTVCKDLVPGESIICDTNSIVAFTRGLEYDVKSVGDCLTCCCSNEGCFHTVLTAGDAPGKVWLQSMSFEKLKNVIGRGSDAPKADGGVEA
jgi:uncharacterized protein (AIM24 family)